MGRVDRQIQIAGIRVEPGEVESALRIESTVQDAVVVARELSGELRLVAYVVVPEQFDLSALRQRLVSRLPSHLIPAAIVQIDKIPLTRNGKVDVAGLPSPVIEVGQVPEMTPLERSVANIFAQVAGLAELKASSNFFEIGGHSLLASRLVRRIRDTFDVEFPLRSLFDAPTVRGVAEYIAAQGGDAVEIHNSNDGELADRGHRQFDEIDRG